MNPLIGNTPQEVAVELEHETFCKSLSHFLRRRASQAQSVALSVLLDVTEIAEGSLTYILDAHCEDILVHIDRVEDGSRPVLS